MAMKQKKLKKDQPSTIENVSLGPNGSESNEEEDEMTKRKNEAMEEALKIPSVVQQIIEGLQDLSDLKSCRRVSPMWLETTTKVMMKRNSAVVVLKFHKGAMKYKKFVHWPLHHYYDSFMLADLLKDEPDIENSHDLTDLKKIVVKSTKFPCSTFVLYKGHLRNPDMQDFFKVVGKSIRNLKLIEVDGMCVKNVALLLGLNCPSLETLYMEGGCINWNPKDISFELPKLKMLDTKNICTYEEGEKSPFKILTSLIAPNLQVIRGFYLSRDLESVFEAGKLHCVKELNCREVGRPDDPTILEIFVQAGPQLETLKLDFHWSFKYLNYDAKSKWMRLIQKLLDLSKTTLTSFRFRGIKDVFVNLHFPEFPQLREIEIYSPCEDEQGPDLRCPYEILRDGISPNLQVIKVYDLARDIQEVVTAGKIHCIKELSFCLERLKLEPLRFFLSIHPKLESLRLDELDRRETIDLDRTRELTGLVEQLLELSKDTLRRFKFSVVRSVYEDMKFPKFSKLEHVAVSTKDPVRIFPRGINLAETFPVLEILDLHGCYDFDKDKNCDECFPCPYASTGSLTSVKTLIFNERFIDAVKRNIRTICPNANVVSVDFSQ